MFSIASFDLWPAASHTKAALFSVLYCKKVCRELQVISKYLNYNGILAIKYKENPEGYLDSLGSPQKLRVWEGLSLGNFGGK